MLVKPDWDVFKAKFHSNPQEYFEWFSYLLFCREFDLDKGWHGYKDQPAVEKEPIERGGEVISFQAKFYQAELSKKKSELVKTLEDARRHYPHLTKIVFYSNQTWTLNYPEKIKDITQTEKDIEALALSLNVEIDWRTNESFFHSPFVCVTNSDLSRYFFDNNDYKSWKLYGDWSSKSTDLEEEYYIDEDVTIISPNHNNLKSITVVEGLNEIRAKLTQPSSSVRLVGLSGVGKTRFAQALFDERIGENALDVRNVWYCDLGDSPDPTPQHFVEQMIEESKLTLVIVDNCGQALHSTITRAIKDSEKVSLLTIEYDVNDGLPEETSVYRMQPTTIELIKKVIERHYPELESININKIADFSGGNYRLALAIASNIEKSDNLSILTDDELFKRIFYQKGELDKEVQSVGQIFSLVFSFNVEDSNETASEINILSELADVTPRKAYRLIEELHAKDIVQKRGNFRAILPHALANNLAKQAISGLSNLELNQLLKDTPERLQTSFLKRLSYLHGNDKVKSLVKKWLEFDGYFGSKILDNQLTETDLRNISLLTSICPDELLDVLKLRHEKDNSFLSISNPNYYSLANLLRNLAYYDKNFEKSFWLLFEIIKTDKDNSLKELFSSLFHYHLSQTEASFTTKKRVIEQLYNNEDYHKYVLDIIDNGLGSDNHSISIYSDDNGLVQTHSYRATYNEIWNWFDFLLGKLHILDIAYPDECRKIFSDNLEGVIFISRRIDEAIKYLKLFHDRKTFVLGLLEVKKIIKNSRYQLKSLPNILRELEDVECLLEPDKNEIKLLLKAHILSSDPFEYKNKRYDNEEYGVTIKGFDDYEDLIDHISKNLTLEVVRENLKGLITSKNENVSQIGYATINVYKKQADFIADLEKVASDMTSIAELPNTRFLLGTLEKLINTDWNSYINLVNFLISEEVFSHIIPQLMIVVSKTKQHFDFLLKKIIQFPSLDFSSFGRSLAFKKLHQDISPKLFEFTLDKLINLNQDNIVLDALLFDSRQNKVIADKYIDKMLELLPNALDSRNYYDYSHALTFLLSHSESTRESIFVIVEEAIKDMDYFVSLSNNSVGRVIEEMIETRTKESLNFIYGNGLFKHVLSMRELKEVFFKANAVEVLDWIDNDQDKINFWFANSKFYQYNEDGVEWLEILHKLLSESNNPEVHLSYVIAPLFEMFSHSGRFSEALSKRLPFFDSLKQYFKNHNHDNLITVVEQKKAEFQRYIEQAEKEEAKDLRKQQGFEW